MNKKIIIVFLSLLIVGIVSGIGYYFFKDDTLNNGNDGSENAQNVSYEEKTVDFTNSEEYNVNLNSINDIYTITKKGVYYFTGNLDGYIKVDTDKNVEIVLDNVNITNNSGPCIYVENVNNLYIKLSGENTLSDGTSYSGFDSDVNAAIFSKDDLIIYGDGKLTINANYSDGIVSKDDLVIENGSYVINAMDDAIRGTDSVVIENGSFIINSKGDGIKSTNENDTTKGNVLIQNGTFNITVSNDAIQAVNNIEIDNGEFTIVTGGGYKEVSSYRGMDGNSSKSSTSSKAIKAGGDILIKNGVYQINSYDDSIHSDNTLEIDNGEFTISTSDDGIHADKTVLINNGTISITSSYEGIEANYITINDGNIKIISRDDGINVSGGNDSSGFGPMGRTTNSGSDDNRLTINGGVIYVNAVGDGLDANGSIYINGGKVSVDGPTDNGNGPLDYDAKFEITGGEIITVGSSGMMQNATSSTQGVVLIYLSSVQSAGTTVTIGDISYTPSKAFSCLLVSSSKLEVGKTYDIKVNGSNYTSITISNTINTLGNGSGVNGMGRNNGRGRW